MLDSLLYQKFGLDGSLQHETLPLQHGRDSIFFFTSLRKLIFLPLLSINTIVTSGLANAIGIPGKPAPVLRLKYVDREAKVEWQNYQ